MGIDRGPIDDKGILPESRVGENKSLLLFRSTIDGLLEDNDPHVRSDADIVKDKLEKGEIGVLCDKRIRLEDDQILITQVKSSEGQLPIFILPADLNKEDLAEIWPSSTPDFIKSAPYADKARLSIIAAVGAMAFALRSVGRRRFDE